MHDHQNPPDTFIEQKRELFHKTVDRIWNGIFGQEAPSKLSVTLLEALLVGVSKNIAVVEDLPDGELKSLYKHLTTHEDFSEAALKEGLSKKLRVIARLQTAVSIFAN